MLEVFKLFVVVQLDNKYTETEKWLNLNSGGGLKFCHCPGMVTEDRCG